MAKVNYLTDVQELKVLPPSLKAARDYWTEIKGDRRFPGRADIDPTDIPRLLPDMELVEVLPPLEDGTPEFRYRLTGTHIDKISRQNYAGCKVSEIPHQRAPSQVHTTLCLAVSREIPVVVRLPYEGPDILLEWVDSLVAPLSDDGITINMLFSVLHPVRRNRNRQP